MQVITAVAHVYKKISQEEFSSFAGYLPTSGNFCEKVDVIKFPADTLPTSYTPVMLADRSWFGRLSLNVLKPYDGMRKLKPEYSTSDLEAYVEGCKTAKGGGVQAKMEQLKSNFQSFCTNHVTGAVRTCSEHSFLCGKGGVAKLIDASSQEQCMKAKGFDNPPICS
mmetsp:Transcript_116936/g.364039  ORF Transcript_116936/g.364039 Transcript_116936/m.364039 type:complete len:166 (-) Transcript_116936:39-536(-)